MKLFKFKLFVILWIHTSLIINAQIDTAWARSYEAGAWDESMAIATDLEGNIYVTGSSYVWNTSCDILTMKYNANGEIQWSKIFSNSSNGWEEGQFINYHKGFIYVAGYTSQGISTSLGSFIVIKYSLQGDTIWTYIENEVQEGAPTAIHFDSDDNIILAGYDGSSAPSAFITLKLDSLGDLLWLKKYSNGGFSDVNKIWDMCLDDSNNIYVTGISDDSLQTYFDIVTIKYAANGDSLWLKRFNGPSNYFDSGRSIRYHADGFIYVGGSTSTDGAAPWDDFVLLKYDTSGNLIWNKFYNSMYNSYDDFRSLEIDHSGNVYAMGVVSKSNNTETNLIQLVKYNSNGDTIWTSHLDLPRTDHGNAMLIDSSSNIYITGFTYNNFGQGYNGLTLKIDSSGVLKWFAEYNGIINNEDQFYSLALDNNNDLIVTGRTKNDSTIMDFNTVKYRNSILGIPLIESGNPSLFLNCFPNPSKDITNINFYIPKTATTKLCLFDNKGVEMMIIGQGIMHSGNHSFVLNTKNLNSGIYYCVLEHENSRIQSKIIILN